MAKLAVLLALATGLLVLGLAIAHSHLQSPEPTHLLRDRHGAFLGEAAGSPDHDADADGYGYWPVGEIPPRVAAATLAVEDRRWHRHPGVDPVAVGRALLQNVQQGERVSGASTIAMQVARLQRPGPRTYARKAVEATTALAMTARHGREAVLRHYLRLVPYGHQIHGIAYASRRYLDKPVADLSWAEVAFLAAIPQAPSRMSPFDPRGRGRAVRRGLQILELLRQDGVISSEEWRVATAQIARLRIPSREPRPEEALHAILRLEDELATGTGRASEAGEALLVRTTLDLDLQREIAWETERLVGHWRRKGAGNAAVLVLERRLRGQGWDVRAAVGSARWGDAEHAGAIDYLRVPRSSGSTLKPFFFARAMDRGLLGPTTVLEDLDRGAGGIVNSDGRFLGPLLPRFALGNSRNVPAADLLARLGVEEGWLGLGELGLHDGTSSPRRLGLGLTLGSLAVTVEDLARAYTALAGDGRVHEPRWIVEEPPAPEEPRQPPRVLSEAAARQVALYLSDPQARLPSFPRMGHLEYPYAVAVKTGTSSRRRDAWTVAFSRRHLVVAWVGHPDHRPMQGLTGYSSAAYLVRQVMDRLHPALENGLADVGFPPPRGHVAVKVCALSGRRAGTACDRVTAEWLPPEDARALAPCPYHRHVAVDRHSGVLANHRTPRSAVEVRAVVADLPPRYARWARDVGLPQMPPPAGTTGGGPLRAALAAGVLAGSPAPAPRRDATIRIVSPRDGQHLLVDPETPAALSTLELRAVVDPPDRQVLWNVDGEPYVIAEASETVRWPLSPGDHTFRAEVPSVGARSSPVRVRVE